MVTELAAPSDRSRVEAIARDASTYVDFEAEASRDFARIWVVRPAPDHEAIAFLLAWFVTDEVHLIDIATDPRRRRQGAARLLIKALLDAAQARGAKVVLLEVRASNGAAINLYREFHFEVANKRRDYYSAPCEDALEMTLTLKDPSSAQQQTQRRAQSSQG